ncbi:MAG: hypothetical protein V1751_04925 [Pseudomonadota bacterium]
MPYFRSSAERMSNRISFENGHDEIARLPSPLLDVLLMGGATRPEGLNQQCAAKGIGGQAGP